MRSIKKIGAMAVVSLFFVTTPAFAVTSDYAHYWSFDDATGRSVTDSGGQNGVMTGSSTGLGWAGGKSGTALGIDGTDGTGVALPDGFLNGSEGTISVWFKMNELSDRNVLFSGKSSSDNNVFVLLGIDHEGRPQLLFRTDPNTSNRLAQVGGILNKNEWYHLVFIATGQSYIAYINGEQKIITGENIGRWFSDFTNQTLNYRIGASIANPLLGSFNGMIDELRIYDRVLSEDEVRALYSEGNAGTPTLPLALRPVLSFDISTDTITSGGSITLNWSSEKVDSCAASDGWSDMVGLSGTRTFSGLTNSASFTLTCSGKGGSISRTVKVNVGTDTTSAPVGGGTLTVTDVTNTSAANSVQPETHMIAFVRDLAFGAHGDDVSELQSLLIKKGYLASGLPLGYFGMLTKDALMKWQTELGLPATGYFGPMSRSKVGATTPVSGVPSTPVMSTNEQITKLLDLIAQLQAQLAILKAGSAQ